jgi:hypothetical protein
VKADPLKDAERKKRLDFLCHLRLESENTRERVAKRKEE